MQSLGSGFIIDPSGLIVTNNHVVDGAETMSVILADGTSLPATLVGRDTVNDIALLRVHPAHPLTAVHFASSRAARIGDWVIAIGNPYGLGGTVTAGIVSARGRDLDEDGSSDYIQTDAAINRGNSGGPLFNMSGEVIGINTAIYSPSGGSVGIGFAIPSDEVAAVVAQLRLYGKPRRGWMGVQVQNVTPDIAAALGMPDAIGAMVAFVAPGGPAARAHLQPGDVILGFDGRMVPDMKSFPRMVEDSGVDAPAVVDYWRAGHQDSATLTIADEPAAPTTAAPGAEARAAAGTACAGLGRRARPDAVRSHAQPAEQVQPAVRYPGRRDHRGGAQQRRRATGSGRRRRDRRTGRHADRADGRCAIAGRGAARGAPEPGAAAGAGVGQHAVDQPRYRLGRLTGERPKAAYDHLSRPADTRTASRAL